MTKMKVYCFGNEFLKEDSLAKGLADEIQIDGIEFVKCNSPDDVLDETDEIVILDAVEGINKIIIINDLNQLKTDKLMSLHNFDLSFFLKLMEKIGKIKKIKIIGIPMKGDKEKIKQQVIRMI